jgi:hypothetical protein
MAIDDIDAFLKMTPYSFFKKNDLINNINSKRPAYVAIDITNNKLVGACMIKIRDLCLGGLIID